MSARSLGTNRRLLIVVGIVVASLLAAWLWSHSNTDPKPPVSFGEEATFKGTLTKQDTEPPQYQLTKVAGQSTDVAITNSNDPIVQEALEPLLNRTVTVYGAVPPDQSPNLLLLWVNGRALPEGTVNEISESELQFRPMFEAFSSDQQACLREAIAVDHLELLLESSTRSLTADDFRAIETCITEHPAPGPTPTKASS